ncbi:MAG: NUDIX hydrolase [Candidatus Helarchaeota archaeon]
MRKLSATSRRYPSRPIGGVGTVLIKDGKVLLIQRAAEPDKGMWSIPGGLIENGETAEEAAIRETFEETGIKVNKVEFVDAVTKVIFDEEEKVQYHFAIFDYKSTDFEGKVQASDDALDAKWVKFEDVSKYPMPYTLQELFRYMNIGKWD